MKVEQLYNACFPLVNLPDIAYLDGRLGNVISVFTLGIKAKSKMQHLILEWTKSCHIYCDFWQRRIKRNKKMLNSKR